MIHGRQTTIMTMDNTQYNSVLLVICGLVDSKHNIDQEK